MLWIFVWHATDDTNARASVFTDYEDAWDDFALTTVASLPDFIVVKDSQGEFEALTSSQFIWNHVNQ